MPFHKKCILTLQSHLPNVFNVPYFVLSCYVIMVFLANIYSKCDMTVTFHKMKQGIPKRKDLTGELFAEKIGIPPESEEGIL